MATWANQLVNESDSDIRHGATIKDWPASKAASHSLALSVRTQGWGLKRGGSRGWVPTHPCVTTMLCFGEEDGLRCISNTTSSLPSS